MVFDLLEPPPSLGVVVYDEDKHTADDLIGDNCVALGSKLTKAWTNRTEEVVLTDRKGHERGVVTCQISWGPVLETRYKLYCKVLACADLPSR